MIELSELPTNGHREPGSPLRILLVDDEPSTLQLVRKVLQADGHEIYEAIDGEQAMEVFEQARPDLVLLDIVIPKMDGVEVLKLIRTQDKMSGVIMVSALTSEELAVRSMLAGADDYVSKPFKLKTIRMNIRRVMEKVRLRRRNYELQKEVDSATAKLREIFKLYMAPSLAEDMLQNPSLPQLGGENKLVTIMFVDICDFTRLSHQLPPSQVVSILNKILAIVTTTVPENGGFLDKIMGDGFMALFPADKSPYHANNAIKSAVAMYSRITDWNKGKERPINITIGINTGEAVVGNIGTEEMMNYTAIGDSVNLAKRLQEVGEDGQILVGEDTYQYIDADELYAASVVVEPFGEPRAVKGRNEAVQIYQVSRIR